MNYINTSIITRWQIATKTQPIQVKSLSSVLPEDSILHKFTLDTLEGKETLVEGSVICLGSAGDVWQQSPVKLLKKYTVTAIHANGWLTCTPIPDNSVDVFEILPSMTNNDATDTFIIGQYGETINGVKNVQRCVEGDFICRSQTDHSDVWIVKRKIFLNTYKIVN